VQRYRSDATCWQSCDCDGDGADAAHEVPHETFAVPSSRTMPPTTQLSIVI
jgi:hypothetical protein